MGLSRLRATLVIVAALAAGCRRPPPPPPPPPPQAPAPKQNLVVLLPSADGRPSGIRVANDAGTATLDQPNTYIRIENSKTQPDAPAAITPGEVQRRYGPLLDRMPLAAAQFQLYFRGTGDEFTAESLAQIPAVLEAIRERRSTDITVIGHTDTTDSAESNFKLGLQRAEKLASVLRSSGVDAASIRTASHGESDLLVQTADGVAEARNRRVEISVR